MGCALMKVFVSSTYQDLLTYRAAATRAILMAGDMSEDMLYWPAAESPPLDESLRHLRSSDLMILLIAHRYGTLPSGYESSITELEFDEATRINLPVLAFLVDPEHAWPPRFMENDREAHLHLDKFVVKVKGRVTVGLYSTPDSLEIAITHALMHYPERRTSVAIPEYAMRRLHHINRAETLFYSPDSTVRVGSAPDGAPLLLAVTRQIPVYETMARIAASVGRRPDDEPFRGIISQLNQEARSYVAASGVHSTNSNDDTMNIFIPNRTLVDLMSPTLFQAMLGVKGQNSNKEGELDFYSETTSTAGLDASDLPKEELVSFGGQNRFLAIALDDNQSVWTGGWTTSRPQSFVLSRPFIEEGLERLPGVRYVIKRRSDRYTNMRASEHDFTIVIDTDVPQRFHSQWTALLTSAGDEEITRYGYEILIPRISIIRFLLEVIEEVGDLHGQGQIHGDIKPSNTLVNRNGRLLIDHVDLAVGDISPTVTVGWSPYEQLVRQPLSCAADVFSLGQMLLHVLGGELLGRQVSYRMPKGKTGIIIEDPSIYMSADGCIGSSVIRKKWCRFIEKALKTDSDHRWENAGVMAEELRTLIDQDGIKGHVSIGLPWGVQPSLVRKGDGDIDMGWIMHSKQLTRIF